MRSIAAGGLADASGYSQVIYAGTDGEGPLIPTPDFQLSVANNPLTISATQDAIFNGTIYPLNGYNSAVNLGCVAAATNPPQSCSVTPSTVLPTVAGVTFAVTASGGGGDYQFDSVVALTLATTSPVPRSASAILAAFLGAFPLGALLWFSRARSPSKRGRTPGKIAAILLLASASVSCGRGLQGNGGGGGG